MRTVLAVFSLVIACSAAQLVISPYAALHTIPFQAAPQVLTHTVVAPRVVAAAPQVIAAPQIIPQTIAIPTSSQYHAQDELGQFAFGHQGDNQAREEVKTFDGSVRGAYSYVDPNGKLINVQYLADNNGFRVLGANNLPEAPAIPAPIELKGPEPVQDTPEVVAARADFEKKFAEVAAAAESSPETPAEPAAAPAEEAKSRKRRQVLLSSPLVHTLAAPTVYSAPLITAHAPVIPLAKTTITTQELKPIDDAPTPANTKKAEITEKKEEIVSPFGSWIIPSLQSRSIILTEAEKNATIPLALPAISPYSIIL